jgi:hypothetical protein
MCAAFGQPPSTLPTSLVFPVSAAFQAPITFGPKGVGATGLNGQRLGGIILV